MLMREFIVLFVLLGLGYVLCILANKEKGLLKTVGLTLGIAIIALSLLADLIGVQTKCFMMKQHEKMKKCNAGMMKHSKIMKAMKTHR